MCAVVVSAKKKSEIFTIIQGDPLVILQEKKTAVFEIDYSKMMVTDGKDHDNDLPFHEWMISQDEDDDEWLKDWKEKDSVECNKAFRDYFNDEIWKAEDEENERKKAEEEERAKEKAEKEKKAPKKSAKNKKKAPAKPTNTAPEPEPEPEKDETEKPVAVVQEEPVTAESLVKKTAEKNRLIIEANNKKLGIGLAETIDLFGTGK